MAHQRVFPGLGFKSHMPFFDGQMLVFCRSDEPVRREFECGGEIWERMWTNRALAEHFRGLARTRWLEYRAWKLYFTSWGMSLSLWEGRALRPGEGPPRPLPRPTLPQAGG